MNIHDIELAWWRSQIGLVQQDPFLFNDTILKNLELGLVGTEWELAEPQEKLRVVEQACREAYAHEFIMALPEVSTFYRWHMCPVLNNEGLRHSSRG